MPAQPKHDTLARLLELLKALPHHRWATPAELREQLADRGFAVDLRSVQRDLKTLQQSFPLDHNDKGRPHGWRWSEQAAGGIASMSTPEALMLVLVQQQLQQALPATMLEGFEALFTRARQRLDRLGPRAGAARWPQQVRAVPPGLPLQPAPVDAAVQKAIADALLAGRELDAQYHPGPAGRRGPAKAYRLHPVGLVLRGGTSYLVAVVEGGRTAQLFALHRFAQAAPRPEPALPGIDLDTALTQGRAQFGIAAEGQAPIELRLACEATIAALLAETPLAPTQAIRPLPDGRTEVRAPVADGWELRWWLLGRGAQVEVLAPAALRREIARLHEEAAARYR